MALAALQAIREAGLEPGRDVAVIGFDDLEAAALAHPPLTTIRQDRRELGILAATSAIELIEDPESAAPKTVLPVELVVRASSSLLGSLDRAEDAADVDLGLVVPAVRPGGVEESRRGPPAPPAPKAIPQTPGTLTGKPAAERPAAALALRRR